jgi:hypothetical protein
MGHTILHELPQPSNRALSNNGGNVYLQWYSQQHPPQVCSPTSSYSLDFTLDSAEPDTYRQRSWWQDPSLRKNAFWLFICALASVYAGYDGSLLNGLQALPKFFETFPGLTDSNLLGLTGAVQFLPGLVVPFAVAYVADRFGRKVALLAASTGIVVGAVIQCTSNTLGVFIASRVIIGTAGQFGLPMSATALVELAQ